ncbi:hypothetical protein ACFX2J_006780 [Malus domestica]
MCSEEAASIEVGHQKPHNRDGNPFRIPLTIHGHSILPLLSSLRMLQTLANSTIKPYSKMFAASTILLPELKMMIFAPQLLHKHSFSDSTKTGPEVVLNLSIISATPEAKFPSFMTDNYGVYLQDKFGWVNWYLVGKFVKNDLCASTLFDEMSKRWGDENMGTLFNFIYYLIHHLQRLIPCHITSNLTIYLKLLIYGYLALNLLGSCINNSIMNTLSGAVIEYRCESCSRVQVIPDQWVASVQLPQHVSHKRWFSYLKQLILKHGFATRAIWIKQMVKEISYEEKANVSHIKIKIIESKGLDEISSPVDIVMFQLAKSVLDAQGNLSGDPSSKVPIEENLVKILINLVYDVGLFYLGNTYYMNSTVHFLHYVPKLKSALIKYSHFERNDEGDQTSYRLTITACALISELDKGIKAMVPVQFWMVLLNKYPHFGSSESPDSIKALFGIELASMVHCIEGGEKGSELVQSFEGHISHERHHFASYLEREWQCSTYDIQVANVLIGAYDKTGTMTTNQMVVAKLVP